LTACMHLSLNVLLVYGLSFQPFDPSALFSVHPVSVAAPPMP
jgi:hypothetical protein